MNRFHLAAGFLILVSTCFGQTSTITSVLNNIGQSRFAPGDSVQIFGAFPTGRRADYKVTVGGLPGSVLAVANDVKLNLAFEIDIQIPTEISPGPASVVVTYITGNIASPPFSITIDPADPVLGGDPFSAFVHNGGVNVTPTLPASPAEAIGINMSGLGATNPIVPTGTDPTVFTPTITPATVTVGGASAQVTASGRYVPPPPFSSLVGYQVTFVVPPDAASGPTPVKVSIGGMDSNPQILFVGAKALPSPPTITGVVSGATFSTSTNIAPNSFVTVFGSGFGTVDNLSAFPSTTVNGISVLFNGIPAPIFSLVATATPQQINVLAPADMPAPGETVHGVAVSVQNQNGPSRASYIVTSASAPAMFIVPDPSNATRHNVAALLANTAWYVMPASQAQAFGFTSCAGLSVSARCGQPARRGDFVQLYGTGLGLATPNGDPNGTPLATGQTAPASGSPTYTTVAKPVVTIGGQPATVVFSGIAPGYAGLYQINIQIPQTAPSGDSVPITITLPRSATDSATIAIQ